jgi:transketolase
MAKDKQSESSKLDQKNAEMDKAQDEGYKRYQKKEADEAKENAAPRKAIGDAINYVKKGLGMKNGGSASSRADGIATKGKTRGRIV